MDPWAHLLGRLEPRVLLSVTQGDASTGFSFEPPASYANGHVIEGAWDIQTADFDGDGKLDLATGSLFTGSLLVLLNNGDGTFPAQPLSVPTPDLEQPHNVGVADLNNDGKVDILVGDLLSDRVDVLLGRGDGTFTLKGVFTTNTGSPGKISAGDFNGDGKQDLAIGSFNLCILLGNGDGTFASPVLYGVSDPTSGLAVADLDHDGILDIVLGGSLANQIHIFQGSGNGSFHRIGTYSVPGKSGPGSEWLRDLVVGDFAGTGHLDIAVVNNIGSMSILLGQGNGTFANPVMYPVDGALLSAAAVDFNGDGRLDLAAANIGDGTVEVFPGNGDGSFQTPLVLQGGTDQARSIAVGDFSGDGKPDIAFGALDAHNDFSLFHLGVFLNNGGHAKPSLQGMVWADFNNDGRVDFGEKGIGGVTIQLTTADGQLVAQTTTDVNGLYTFGDLMPGTYSITETSTPGGFLDGKDSLGTITDDTGNPIAGDVAGDPSVQNVFSDIRIGFDQNGVNYNFGEVPAPRSAVSKGQAAGIGFWQNKNGQALIRKFLDIGPWLAATLPNTFGALAGMSSQQVAVLYQQQFVLKDKLNAQYLATALNVYATNASLGGTYAAGYGFAVSQYGLGTATFSVGRSGAAFGVSDNAALTVMQILQLGDVQRLIGSVDQVLRRMAVNVFGGINDIGGL